MRPSPENLRNLLISLSDGTLEPFYDEYSAHLKELNRILTNGRTANLEDPSWHLEGNLFFGNQAWPIPEGLEPNFLAKRQNFALYATTGSSMLEIGCNAGHSALLALTANRSLKFTGVDLGWHPYTQQCFQFLRDTFGDRVELLIGDSRDVIPTLWGENFDLFHIDAGHGFAVAQADLSNVLRLSRRGQVILFDDMDFDELRLLVDYYCLTGVVSRITPPIKYLDAPLQAFLCVNRQI